MTDALVGQIVAGAVTLGVAFIGYLKLKAGQKQVETKMDKVEVKVDGYSKQVDGMKTELVNAVGAANLAQGKEEGRVQQRAEAKEDSAAVTDVKIVDQTDPVKVVTEKPDKNKPT